MRVLLAETTAHPARPLRLSLTQAGLIVDCHDRGDDVMETMRLFRYDIAVLDSALPVVDGVQILHRLRRSGCNTPVVLLTADPDPRFNANAFGAGADDVVVLPCDQGEFVARLHAIVRRARGSTNAEIRIAGFEVDLSARLASFEGRPVHLTGKEFSVLQLMILCRGVVLSKDIFMDHLYSGMNEPDAKIIDVFVSKLRRKLQGTGLDAWIVTVRGRGYMLREERYVAASAPPPTTPSLAAHFVPAPHRNQERKYPATASSLR